MAIRIKTPMSHTHTDKRFPPDCVFSNHELQKVKETRQNAELENRDCRQNVPSLFATTFVLVRDHAEPPPEIIPVVAARTISRTRAHQGGLLRVSTHNGHCLFLSELDATPAKVVHGGWSSEKWRDGRAWRKRMRAR